jgi:hypothetical protein
MNAPTASLSQAATIPSVTPPPQPKSLADTGLSHVMMRDILLKTMFRMNLNMCRTCRASICLPVTADAGTGRHGPRPALVEATGTLHATSGNEMGYQLTDAGKARALDALSQSEYYGAMPVPLEMYKEQVKRQSVRNITLTRRNC